MERGESGGFRKGEREGQAHPQPLPQAGGEAVRVHPNKHREAQVARTGGRKLFNRARKKAFLEWFAATANLGWAAEKALGRSVAE